MQKTLSQALKAGLSLAPCAIVLLTGSAWAELGANLLRDSDMELAHARTWPVAGAVDVAEKTTRSAHEGRQSLHVVASGRKWGGLRKIVTGLKPDATYRLSYWVRSVRGDARVDVAVGNGRQWVTVIGGAGLDGHLIWWPGSFYVSMHDPRATKPNEQIGKVTQLRIQFRAGPGGLAEFYLDDVELREWLDPLRESLIADGSFERTEQVWRTEGGAERCSAFSADRKSCMRLAPGAKVQQTVRLLAQTWYALRYAWTTPRQGRVRVGVMCRTPRGGRYLDLRTGAMQERPYLVSPYRQGGFAGKFARVGVTFRTGDNAEPYMLVFDNAGADEAFLDGVALGSCEPASAQWKPFEIPYDGDGSRTGGALRDMGGFLREGPYSLEDVRARRTSIDRAGFIRVGKDGHFVNGREERVRFFAVNMPGAFAMAKTMKDARRIANRLAKLGVNLVRIHGADFKSKPWAKDRPGLFGPPSWKPGTAELYPESLRRLDAFLAQCKAHGIYVQLDLMTSRTFTPADGVADLDTLLRITPWHRTRLFVTSYDQRMIDLQKRFQEQLLSHVNEYTGQRYADDPVIASVELKNEEGLLYCGFTRGMYKGYPPHYQRQLADRWNAWLKRRYLTTAALRGAWAQKGRLGLGEGERLGSVAFAPALSAPQNYSDARYADMVRFVGHIASAYQDAMVAKLRGLGLKCPIRDTQAQLRPCMLRLQSRMDYVDAHSYWNAPFDQPMVRSAGGNIVGPSFIAVAGKPMSVSEYNSKSGHKYRAEMPIVFAAYAALQDWDSITMHAYGASRGRIEDMTLAFHYINIYGDSPVLAQFPAAARIFRNVLVQPARRVVQVQYNQRQCDSGALPALEINPEVALVHKVRTDWGDAKEPAGPQLRPLDGTYTSDTNELRWNTTVGIVTIEAPRVEAAIGLVAKSTIRLKHMALKAETSFAAISLVALDDRSLFASESMLLTAAAQAENTAMAWDRNRTQVLNYGHAPVVCEFVVGQVMLRHTKGLRVFALGPDGKRQRQLPTQREDNALSFRLDPKFATLWYEIAIRE